MRSTIVMHIAGWIALSIGWFLLSERVVKKLMPGFDSVEWWLFTVFVGSGVIFLGMLTSLYFFHRRKRRMVANRASSAKRKDPA